MKQLGDIKQVHDAPFVDCIIRTLEGMKMETGSLICLGCARRRRS